MRAVMPDIIEGHRLLHVCSSRGYLSQTEGGLAQRAVSFQEERWVSYTLGQGKELFTQLTCALKRRPVHVKPPEPCNTGKSWGVSPTCRQSSRARA